MREYANGMYGVVAYFMGKTVSEIPNQTFFPVVFGLCTYWVIELNDDSNEKWIIYLLVLICLSYAGVSMGILCGCIFSDIQVAVSAAPLAVIPFMLFGGFLINVDNIPSYFVFMEYLSPFKYSFGALAQNEYHSLDLDCEPICSPLDDLSISEDMITNIILLNVLTLFYRVMSVIILKATVTKLGS